MNLLRISIIYLLKIFQPITDKPSKAILHEYNKENTWASQIGLQLAQHQRLPKPQLSQQAQLQCLKHRCATTPFPNNRVMAHKYRYRATLTLPMFPLHRAFLSFPVLSTHCKIVAAQTLAAMSSLLLKTSTSPKLALYLLQPFAPLPIKLTSCAVVLKFLKTKWLPLNGILLSQIQLVRRSLPNQVAITFRQWIRLASSSRVTLTALLIFGRCQMSQKV